MAINPLLFVVAELRIIDIDQVRPGVVET